MSQVLETIPKPVKITNIRAEKFINRLLNPWLFRAFLIWKLPMGFLAGMRVSEMTMQECKTTVPYRWLNQNPFRSTYFAVLSMAAELSTGALALMAVDLHDVPVSTLIVGMESEFVKKATNLTTFHCKDGQKIIDAVQQTVDTGEAKQVTVQTVGTNEQGKVVARFTLHWSFKRKKS